VFVQSGVDCGSAVETRETHIAVKLRALPDSWTPEDPHPPWLEDWHCVIDAVFLSVVTGLLIAILVMASHL
jgi:hypothetical protein